MGVARKYSYKYELFITNLNLKMSGVVNFICLIIYKICLDIIYCLLVGDHYTSYYLNPSIINIINGWLIVIIMAYFLELYYKQNTCSAIFMIVVNIVYFIPITTYCGYGGGSSGFLFFSILYWLILSILQYKIPVVTFKIKHKTISNKLFYIFIGVVSIVSLYIWIRYTDLRILINFSDIYEIRREANSYRLPEWLSYFRSIINVIVPMLLILALYRKKYFIILWLLFITLINFSFSGNKTVILFPVVLIGGYVFFRNNMTRFILPGAIVIQILAFIENIMGLNYLTSYVFRRLEFSSAALSNMYYSFFMNHPTDIFRNGFIGRFGYESVYNQNIAKVIGNNFRTQIINCNNGMLADVWAHLGIIGIIIMPIIIIICLRLLDMSTYGIDLRFAVGMILYYVISFTNSNWSTVLLTHGFIAVCIMFFVFPKEKTGELRL